MCEEKYSIDLTTMIKDFNELENKLVIENEKRKQEHKYMIYRIYIIRSLISHIKYSKSTQNKTTYYIPIGYNKMIITNLLDNYVKNNIMRIQFSNIDKITGLHETFDICWDDEEKLIKYILSEKSNIHLTTI